MANKDDDLAALRHIVEDTSAVPRLRRRAQMVMGVFEGDSVEDVARRCASSPRTVRMWIARVRSSGVEGLQDRPRAGRPRFGDRPRSVADLEERRTARVERGRPAGMTRPEGREGSAQEVADTSLIHLLQAACETVSRLGVAATRIEDIARIAKVSPATVHYYFHSKEDLLLRSLLWANSESAKWITDPTFEQMGVLERLCAFVQRSLPMDRLRINEYLIEVELWTQVRCHPELLRSWEEYNERWIGQLAELVAEGVRQGVFRTDDDPDIIARQIVCISDGASIPCAMGAESMPIDRVRTLVFDFVENRLALPAGSLRAGIEENGEGTHQPRGKRKTDGSDHLRSYATTSPHHAQTAAATTD